MTSRHRLSQESPRDCALRILKVRGAMTIVELARAMRLTQTAVRRHLMRLKLEGLVASALKHQPTGRPLNVYRLTEKATTDYFPTGYEELAARMLATVYDTDGHRSVFNYLTAANQVILKEMLPELDGKSLSERVRFIADHFAANGYMTGVKQLSTGKFFLYHQNCPILNLATKYRQLCFVELKLIEAIAGVKVRRQQYIFKNQPICGYLIGSAVMENGETHK